MIPFLYHSLNDKIIEREQTRLLGAKRDGDRRKVVLAVRRQHEEGPLW